jgi:hypothetical protein
MRSCEENAFLWAFAKERHRMPWIHEANAQIKEAQQQQYWCTAGVGMTAGTLLEESQLLCSGGCAAAMVLEEMYYSYPQFRNVLALRMLSFLQDLLDCETRGAQRAARKRVKCTVLLHCIRIPDMLFRGFFITSIRTLNLLSPIMSTVRLFFKIKFNFTLNTNSHL